MQKCKVVGGCTQYIDVWFNVGLLILGFYSRKFSILLNSTNNNNIIKTE